MIKKWGIILLVILLATVLCIFGLEKYVKSKIENALSTKLPEFIKVHYNNLSVSVLQNFVEFDSISIRVQSDSLHSHSVENTKLKASGLSFYNYLINNKINVEQIRINHPFIRVSKKFEAPKSNLEKTPELESESRVLPIIIESLVITNGKLLQLKSNSEKEKFSIGRIHLQLDDLTFSHKTVKQQIPFTFSSAKGKIRQIQYCTDFFEVFKIDNLKVNKDQIVLENTSHKSSVSKRELSRLLKKERDYVHVETPKMVIKQPHFQFMNNDLRLNISKLVITNPTARFYRDKRLPDDTSNKKLYGQSLKELPFLLQIDSTEIQNGHVSYQEETENSKKLENLYFSDFNASILDLGNTVDSCKVKINTSLMGAAPLEMNWNFGVLKNTDQFSISGIILNLNANALNPFLISNLQSKATGSVKELYFDTYGNPSIAKGNMKMKYENFEFKVLKKDRLGVNKLLTSIGKLLVNNGSKTDSKGYRYGQIETERNPEKSFFNYLWLQVRDGMISTMIGDGKKQ